MNKELLEIAKKAAEAWKNTEGYTFASDLISQLCAEIESPRDWTPCDEGLPDTNDDVYITYEYRGKLIAAIGFMGHSGAWYILEDDDGNEAKVNAIAWQPLPAPYRADDTT